MQAVVVAIVSLAFVSLSAQAQPRSPRVTAVIEDLVVAGWGAETWAEILKRAGVDDPAFVGMSRYPDELAGKIVGAASAVLKLAPEDVMRPSAWSNLGTADPEGADFKACETFGPLYGRR